LKKAELLTNHHVFVEAQSTSSALDVGAPAKELKFSQSWNLQQVWAKLKITDDLFLVIFHEENGKTIPRGCKGWFTKLLVPSF